MSEENYLHKARFRIQPRNSLPDASGESPEDNGLSDKREGKLVEDGEEVLRLDHEIDHSAASAPGAALVVDGVSRPDDRLAIEHPETGETILGETGAVGAGAALVLTREAGNRARVIAEKFRRVAIWHCEEQSEDHKRHFGIETPDERPTRASLRWDAVFAGSGEGGRSLAPNETLVNSEMRLLEEAMVKDFLERSGAIGQECGERVHHLIVDGPLSLSVREYLDEQFSPGYGEGSGSEDPPYIPVGHIKDHRAEYLAEEEHLRLRELGEGCRSSLFQRPSRPYLYSAYLRLPQKVPDPFAEPWSGIVRIELPAPGLEEAKERADAASRTLIALSGHNLRDNRAPRNLMPVAALEDRLRRKLGDEMIVRRGLRRAAMAREGDS